MLQWPSLKGIDLAELNNISPPLTKQNYQPSQRNLITSKENKNQGQVSPNSQVAQQHITTTNQTELPSRPS